MATKTPKPIKYGAISLTPFADPQHEDYVPDPETYIDEHGYGEVVAWAIENNEDVLLEGRTGVGKTALLRAMCGDLNRAYRRVPCQEATDTAALIGKPWLWVDRGAEGEAEGTGEQEMIFQRGIVYDAVMFGHTLVLDEWNLAHPDVQLALNPLFAVDEGSLIVMENEGEVVPRHADFRLFATANPSDYAGTKAWNPAARSRFGAVIQMEHLSPEFESKLVAGRVPQVDASLIEAMVNAASLVREAEADRSVRFAFSVRELTMWASFVASGFGVARAAEFAVTNKAEGDDQESIGKLMQQAFDPKVWK